MYFNDQMKTVLLKRCVLSLLLLGSSVIATAQRGDEMAHRTSMVNDSVRLEESYLSKSGQVLSRRYYMGARPVGVWQQFDRKGRLTTERDFAKLHYGKMPDLPKDTVKTSAAGFFIVEEMPGFPGGEQALFEFLSSNVRYPDEAIDEGLSGTVYLTGMLDETGDWSTLTIMRSAHPLLDYEAWRVAELMPNWSPGKQNGVPVKVYYNIPLRFSLR